MWARIWAPRVASAVSREMLGTTPGASDRAATRSLRIQEVDGAVGKIESAGCGATDSEAELDTAIRQIVSENMTGTGVVDIYAEARIANPDISLIDDAFVKKITDIRNPLSRRLAHT